MGLFVPHAFSLLRGHFIGVRLEEFALPRFPPTGVGFRAPVPIWGLGLTAPTSGNGITTEDLLNNDPRVPSALTVPLQTTQASNCECSHFGQLNHLL